MTDGTVRARYHLAMLMQARPQATGTSGTSIGQRFDPRRNSLNFLRLMFALLVLVGHAATLGGYSWQLWLIHSPLEDIAVNGFFAISGYLITASALRSNTVRYLWQRVLRIFPGYWVCLVTVAFGFGIVGWLHDHANLSGYFGGPNGAVQYVLGNADLQIAHYPINGSPAHVPYQGGWNGSIWTLQWEFRCYLIVGALALVRLLRRRPLVIALLLVAWALEALQLASPTHFGPLRMSGVLVHLSHHFNELRFVPIFLAGALVYLYKDKLPDSTVLLAAFLAFFVVGCAVSRNGGDFVGPLLAYPCIWAGAHLPFERVGAKNDLSYGIYIYAWPITQLLAVWGVNRWGPVPYVALILVATFAFATASWTLVEKQVLKMKRWSPGHGRTRSEPVPAAAMGG
jgi:peptidoglycan/LPS O-acetylase OafA/YrhL